MVIQKGFYYKKAVHSLYWFHRKRKGKYVQKSIFWNHRRELSSLKPRINKIQSELSLSKAYQKSFQATFSIRYTFTTRKFL